MKEKGRNTTYLLSWNGKRSEEEDFKRCFREITEAQSENEAFERSQSLWMAIAAQDNYSAKDPQFTVQKEVHYAVA